MPTRQFLMVILFVFCLMGCSDSASAPPVREEAELSPQPVATATAVAVEELTNATDLPLYFVGEYSETRNPHADLKEAIKEAQRSERRILLEIGGDWCIDCHILEGFLEEHEAVATQLKENFVIVKVNLSPENLNEAFLQQYPEVTFVPHFFVLESSGDFLYSQGTEELEGGDSYSPGRFIAFVDKWSPQ